MCAFSFSRSRGADDGFFAGHDRPSLHELWHAFARRYERAGERGSERYEESFERRHGGRGDWHESHGDERGHVRHGRHGERDERRDHDGYRFGRQGTTASRFTHCGTRLAAITSIVAAVADASAAARVASAGTATVFRTAANSAPNICNCCCSR